MVRPSWMDARIGATGKYNRIGCQLSMETGDWASNAQPSMMLWPFVSVVADTAMDEVNIYCSLKSTLHADPPCWNRENHFTIGYCRFPVSKLAALPPIESDLLSLFRTHAAAGKSFELAPTCVSINDWQSGQLAGLAVLSGFSLELESVWSGCQSAFDAYCAYSIGVAAELEAEMHMHVHPPELVCDWCWPNSGTENYLLLARATIWDSDVLRDETPDCAVASMLIERGSL